MSKIISGLRKTVIASALTVAASSAQASGYAAYEVTITNVTNSINFTPVMVASHRKNMDIFEAGEAASPELTAIAEGGDIAPLSASILAADDKADVQDSGGLLPPGHSVTVTVRAKGRRISIASMMLPTNDGFIGLSNIKAPRHGSATYYSPGYDAGTETNDELCVNIPGPTCGGAGPSPEDDGEGYVHINRGIHGIGDLAADVYDWRNPVAKITIKRVNVRH